MKTEEILAERDAALLKYKAAYLKLRELAQDYLDAVDRDSVSQSDDEYIKEQALRDALKNE